MAHLPGSTQSSFKNPDMLDMSPMSEPQSSNNQRYPWQYQGPPVPAPFQSSYADILTRQENSRNDSRIDRTQYLTESSETQSMAAPKPVTYVSHLNDTGSSSAAPYLQPLINDQRPSRPMIATSNTNKGYAELKGDGDDVPKPTPEPSRARKRVKFSQSDTPLSADPKVTKSKSKRPMRVKATRKRSSRVDGVKLDEPLSAMANAPVRDMRKWIERSVEDRHRERARRGSTKPPRPMNSFMIYRAAYSERAKTWCGQNHQDISILMGKSWVLEPKNIKLEYERLATLEKDYHGEAFPDYKYSPNETSGAKRKLEDPPADAADKQNDGVSGKLNNGRSKKQKREDTPIEKESPVAPVDELDRSNVFETSPMVFQDVYGPFEYQQRQDLDSQSYGPYFWWAEEPQSSTSLTCTAGLEAYGQSSSLADIYDVSPVGQRLSYDTVTPVDKEAERATAIDPFLLQDCKEPDSYPEANSPDDYLTGLDGEPDDHLAGHEDEADIQTDSFEQAMANQLILMD